ncbi:MAG: efflux RND transporter permease subunit, partial [Alphaproteobacteria bacterium]|nr:efflux RND transporter permease subunit [Alphaproteobacteria bacterium]
MHRLNLSHWAIRHQPLVLFLIIMLAVVGAASFWKLGRAEDPSFTIKVVTITAVWPGASAQEMRTQVADPIEKKLQETPYLSKVETYTKPSFAAFQVVLKDTTPPSQVPSTFYVVRKKIWDLRPQLPSSLIGPNINDEYGDVDSILYTVTIDGDDYAQLKRVAENVRQQMLRIDDVAKVNVYGTQDEKIFVEFSGARLSNLGIPPQAIFDCLAKQNALNASGMIETEALRIPLRVSGPFDGVASVRQAPVEASGKVFRLG